jgi:RimJ/RimL family protein N-acetyltransferase
MSQHASNESAASPSRPPPPVVLLRRPTAEDIPVLFRYQLDPESNRMAGTKPRDEEAFGAVWERILSHPDAVGVIARVVVVDGVVVGSISKFKPDGVDGPDAVGYWIAREHWGRGIGSRTLRAFLAEVSVRPLYATAARSNAASIRILGGCGFRLMGYEMGEETERYSAREVGKFVLD